MSPAQGEDLQALPHHAQQPRPRFRRTRLPAAGRCQRRRLQDFAEHRQRHGTAVRHPLARRGKDCDACALALLPQRGGERLPARPPQTEIPAFAGNGPVGRVGHQDEWRVPMTNYLNKSGLSVDAQLVTFVETEALPGTGIAPAAYWAGLAGWSNGSCRAIANCWRSATNCRAGSMPGIASMARCRAIPRAIRRSSARSAIWMPEPGAFEIETSGLDPEISTICGPQLVVPVVECALCAQRRQCALGLALRCALRHRRDFARGRADAGQGVQPQARRGGGGTGRRISRCGVFRSKAAAMPR